MLKLVVMQAGQPDREVVVPGDVATIGRTAPCDLVVDQPYVSKRHLRILHGTVAVDLGSSNGTFVDGQRVTEAVLLGGRTLMLSPNGVTLRVETETEEEAGFDRTLMSGAYPENAELESLRSGYGLLEREVARLKQKLAEAKELARPIADADPDLVASERLRSEYALLEAEVARLKRELAAAREQGGAEAELARLTEDNENLRRRLDSLKRELEGREEDDGESVQARLAMQRVENVQDLNEKLQTEVDRLRAELARREAQPARAPAAPAPGAEDARLQAAQVEASQLRAALARAEAAAKLHQDQTALIRKLREELENAQHAGSAPAGAPGQQQALEASRREAAELRTRVAELEERLEVGAPAGGAGVSDLFFKLQKENAELRKKVSALEAGAGAAPAPSPRDAKMVKELMEARLRIAALESELSNLKVTSEPSTASFRPPAPAPAKSSVPAAPATRAAASGFDVTRVLRIVVDKDVEGLARPIGGPVDEFVVVETVRLLRQIERVVTRVAGDLIQLFQLQTILPDTVGSYRGLVGDLLADAANDAKRRSLVEYLEQLGRWLVTAIGAHRKGAVLFAEQIKADLSEKSLTAKDPLPAYARVPMLAGNELWRRTQDYLKRLTPDSIDERVDGFARKQAQELLNETTGAGAVGGSPRVDAWKRS